MKKVILSIEYCPGATDYVKSTKFAGLVYKLAYLNGIATDDEREPHMKINMAFKEVKDVIEAINGDENFKKLSYYTLADMIQIQQPVSELAVLPVAIIRKHEVPIIP